MTPFRAILLDVDGVLVVGWDPIPGAAEAIARLRELGVGLRLVTNTSSESRAGIATRLRDAGIAVEPQEVVTAVVATGAYLRTHHPGARALVLSDEASLGDLGDVRIEEEDADVVVIGGAGPSFSYERLDHAFRLVAGGAPLVAMHRSLYWRTPDGLHLDGGAFVRALEEAAGVEATVCGKPSPGFFRSALAELGAEPQEAAMVGDDILTDVLAAQAAGLVGVLVRTGKFRPQDLERAPGPPDHVIDSVGDLPALLERLDRPLGPRGA
ncbi:MAG TPA: TIGR01458 family HAD-type hydrolase [Actinomycetota bacterium]|nr:TIGR01458 family HAD-type hydrolase [Actinomycetota bacterium]